MSPFDVLIKEVPDPKLGPLLTQLRESGFTDPVVSAPGMHEIDSAADSKSAGGHEIPSHWEQVKELEGQRYRWPDEEEHYERYVVYRAKTEREGTVQIALGDAGRAKVFGRDRRYTIAFLTSGSPQIPLVEFLETDDFAETKEMLAIIRGRDGAGSRAMFGPTDSLPDVYSEHFRTELYSDRVQFKGAWRKLAVVARIDDPDSMLNHALVQARRRGDL
jgi:hypothetical protein